MARHQGLARGIVLLLVLLGTQQPSRAMEDPRMTLPGFVSGTFRPKSSEFAKVEKKLSQPISPGKIGTHADLDKNANLNYVAARIFEFGYEVPSDPTKAKEYYARAAASNIPGALARMAWYSASERRENRSAALTMMKKAAADGNTTGVINLAAMQLLGFDGEAARETGLKTLRDLAYQDIPDAQYCLGAIYLEGKVVPPDYERALSWLRPAADKGQTGALLELASCYKNGIGVTASPELAFKYNLEAAKAGVTEAQHEVGSAYLNGLGVPLNHEKATFWLRKSAKKEMTASMALLGGLLATGPTSTEESRQEGILWLQKASDRGHPLAQYFLAALYLNLTGSSPYYDYATGETLLRASAESGNPGAQTDLAQMLRFGTVEGLKADKIEAAKWAYLASRSNYRLGQEMLEKIRSTMTASEWQQAQQRAEKYLAKPLPPPRTEPKEKDKGEVKFRY